MKKNMKKYSVREVMEIACDEKMVFWKWPFNKFKKLTVTDMVKRGLKKNVDVGDLQFIIFALDEASWIWLMRGSYRKLIADYIALEE